MATSVDDLLHLRVTVLGELRELEHQIATTMHERASIAARTELLEAEIKKHSTALVAAGYRAPVSRAGACPPHLPAEVREEATLVTASLYATADVGDASITDEESLHRLLWALQQSELELKELNSAAMDRRAVPTDSDDAGAEALRIEAQVLQEELARLRSQVRGQSTRGLT
jgi:hypothetical protein